MRPIAIRAVLGMNHHRFAIACALYVGEILGVLLLFGSGLLGLIGIGWRRRRM